MQRIERGYLVINVSDNKDNYGQRNNKYVHKNCNGITDVSAGTMCNGTSEVMAADYDGWKFPDGKFEQPEDNFLDFMMSSKEVDDYYRTAMPTLYADYKKEILNEKGKPAYYTPNEVHKVLAFAFNKWMGSEVVTFKENVAIIDLIKELVEGRACVLSGKFNKLNHIVCLVGAKWKVTKEDATPAQLNALIEQIVEQGKMPDSFIIDDPYGDYHTDYMVAKGNDIEVPFADFIHIFKPIDNASVKMAHIFKSGAATI